MLQRKLAFTALAAVGLAASGFAGALNAASLGKGTAMTLENPRFLELAKLPDLAQAAGKGLEQFRSLADAESLS